MVKYKVGTISEILAKESGDGGGQKADPKLAALFGGSGGSVNAVKVFRTVKVEETRFKKEPADDDDTPVAGKKKGKKDKVKDIKLKNKDAAGIRVGVKKKVKIDIEDEYKPEVEVSPVAKKGKKNKKKNKLQKKVDSVQDETISSTTAVAGHSSSPLRKADKKNKKRQQKRKLNSQDNQDQDIIENDASPAKKSKLKKPKKKKGRKEAIVKKEEPASDGDDDDDKMEEESDPASEEEEDDAKDTKPSPADNVFKTLAEKNAPKPKDPEQEARTIFVGNLPGDTDKKLLMKIFRKFGKIETVRLRGGAPSKPTQLKKVAINKKELHSDKNTVTAYIRFATKEDAESAAVKGKGLMIKENHLVLDLADQGKKKDNKKAIFVGNLYMKLTDEELWRFFEDCGTILSVRVIRDNATGLGKGFGYVNFEEREAVDKALLKNQQELRNRTVRISRCVKKLKVKNKGGPGGGGKKSPGGKDKNNKAPPEATPPVKGKQRRPGKERWRDRKPAEDAQEYSGDRLAEIGKLKRKSNKPNRGELKKQKIAKLLTGKSVQLTGYGSKPPNARQASINPNTGNKKRYFK